MWSGNRGIEVYPDDKYDILMDLLNFKYKEAGFIYKGRRYTMNSHLTFIKN